ncbi:FCD domain-containing protein [Pelagicoccus sp. SDUM812005]|uniref:FadR/GntR family transcriptional regulator n=1 Tax=Pelagicoccus sp. SDUM812005 TaxID=3041257 RepID=UPI00280D412D|nr:FCD domain-containing protein [Pelagicoccus sp. SDUM812005]MDQ8180046.1 FCD domain-containing protein [Pelagicoccus sp. SDUM812005]
MIANTKQNRIKDVTQLLLKKYAGPERNWLPPERSLAQELEISRPLLREAIKQLQIQGYLEPIHGVGVKVVHLPNAPIKALLEKELPPSKDRIRQFSDLRLLVEPQIAAWAAERAPTQPRLLKKLQAIHQNMVEAPNYEEQVEHDIAFHRYIAELADNQVLTLMLSAVADLETENRTQTLAAVGVNKSIKQHAAILSAIEQSDPAAAKRAMRTHIESACEQTK